MQPTAQNKNYTSLATMATLVAVHMPASIVLLAPYLNFADAEALTLPPSIRKSRQLPLQEFPAASNGSDSAGSSYRYSLLTARSASVKLP